MKTIPKIISALAMASVCWFAHADEQGSATNAAPSGEATAATETKKSDAEKPDAPAAEAEKPVVKSVPNAPPPAPVVISETDRGLRFNFRGAPLEMVLNYLSEAAGFIIVLDADVKGKVDLFSNQPLTKGEAVTLLNTVLEKNGLAAIRSDRTLTIVSRDDAKKRDIPVKAGSEPNDIPKNNDMVTQILPVRSLNAKQLASDLASLTPATLTANEAGNALVVTDTQANIHRIAEIIKALDSSTVSTVKVFPLKFADSKALATVIKDVFQNAPSESRSSDFRSMFWDRMRGEGEGSHHDHGSSGGSRGGSNSRVVATADEYSNSLIVSAPDDLMAIISDLVGEVDKNIDDVTAIRVFHLKHADPVEMSELLTSLFPDDTKTNEGDRPRGFFPFSFYGDRGSSSSSRSSSRGESASDQSDRTRRKNRVIAVPDRRTASVVVTASKDLIDQIGKMVDELDANPAKKQKVFVYSLENADVQEVEQILQNLFQSSTSRNTANNQNNNALSTRQNNAAQQQQPAATTGFGTSGGFGTQTPR